MREIEVKQTPDPFCFGDPKSVQKFDLYAGNKHLEVFIGAPSFTVSGYIKNMNSDRIPGATTAIYEHVHRMITKLALETNQDFRYSFRTQNEMMRVWAENEGKRIFDWDTEGIQDDGFYEANKDIKPGALS